MSNPPLPPRWSMVGRGLLRRCPRCGAKAFESWFRIKKHCDMCGLEFEREPGYWVGAVIINTTVTFGTFIALFVILVLATWPEVPWGTIMAVTIVVNAVVPIAFYPVSMAVWLALELSWHPLEDKEMESARGRATLPEFQSGP